MHSLMFNCLLTSEGMVEMLGKESIHAIVLGVFSVAIMSEDIKFKFKWVSYIEKKNDIFYVMVWDFTFFLLVYI
jgi:hypothetical protein